MEQYRPESKPHQSKKGLEGVSGETAKAEEFCKSMTDLISVILTEGGEVPGGHGVSLASNVLWLVPTLPLNLVLMTCMDLPPEEYRIVSGEMPRSFPSGPSIPSLLPSSPLMGSTVASSPAMRSTIRFSQAVIQPVTHVSPAVDFSFFKKPVPAEVSTLPVGWKSLGASSIPWVKTPLQALEENLGKAAPTVDLMGCDDEELLTPCKESSSGSKEIQGSSKCWGSPPTKKACMDSSGSHKGSRSKSCKSSCTSWNKWGDCRSSTKEPEYKQIHYLMFTPMTDLEQELFKKCSFDQPPILYPSPLRALDKPSPGSKSTYSNATHWLQKSMSNIDHFWKDNTALVKALRQYHFASNVLEGHTQWKFQKSHILHQVLDVIAIHMEDTKRCLDYHDSMPVDQTFRHCKPEPPSPEDCGSRGGHTSHDGHHV